MKGGSAEYPASFEDRLPNELHGAANITSQDKAFADLPKFVGSYGGMTGGRRSTRKENGKCRCRGRCMCRKMRGGVANVDAPSMILTPAEEGAAYLNPQWYNENKVVPSFQGPDNAYAARNEAQYATQFSYSQRAGKRSRKHARRH